MLSGVEYPKATLDPSGDKIAADLISRVAVSAVSLPVSKSLTHTSSLPERFEINASRLPSRETNGPK
jgi:hypothetical protein